MNIYSSAKHIYSKYIVLAILLLLSMGQSAAADSVNKILIPTVKQASQVNAHTVGVVFTHEELFHQLVHNMEDELEPISGLRIVPVMGKNHVQSIYDLLYLSGIDLAMVRADAIEYVRRVGNFPSINGVVRSVMKVSEEKIIIVAHTDIKTIEDLRGKDVVIGSPGSGEYVTGSIAFDSLGLSVNAMEVSIDAGIEKIKSGDIAAFVYLLKAKDAAQSPASKNTEKLFNSLSKGNNIHVLPIAQDNRLSKIYTPVKLSHEDVPHLLDDGEDISTYSVDSILAAYSWPAGHARLKKLSRFVDALVEGLDGLKTSRYQPTWQRVTLNDLTPNIKQSGLVRFILNEKQRELEEQRIAEQERIRAEKAAKIELLTQQRKEILELLSQKIDNADADETERLLKELNQFMSVLEAEPTESAKKSTE